MHTVLATLSPSPSHPIEASPALLPPGIIEKFLLYNPLIRPCFDAPALLRFIASELRLYVVFVTANVKLVIPAFKRPPSCCSSSNNESILVFLADFCDPMWAPTDCCNPSTPTTPVSEKDFNVTDVFSPEMLPSCVKVSRISPEGVVGEQDLYFVGADSVLDSLLPLNELLTSHALFFKSRRLLPN